MSVEAREPESRDAFRLDTDGGEEAGPLGDLPQVTRRQLRLEQRLRTLDSEGGPLAAWASGIEELTGASVVSERAEVVWRTSGLKRPHLVAQLSWPRLTSRLGLGIETGIAHAVVDRLLGYDRHDSEQRLQLTPVEWGILTYFIARGLTRLRERSGPLGRWDLTLDRVNPDPFDTHGLGVIVTLRWPVRIGAIDGSVRLWVPESLVVRWAAEASPPLPVPDTSRIQRPGEFLGEWRARAGKVEMPRGLATLRVGGVLPLSGTRLAGTPQSPVGPVELVVETGRDGVFRFLAEPIALSGGGRLTLTSSLQRDLSPPEDSAMNPSAKPAPSAAPNDVPITLIVELGRVNLSLARLADLKPGDVLELGRHSREPVELTSGGRLVARGELVQIDTELGVRVTNVFL